MTARLARAISWRTFSSSAEPAFTWLSLEVQKAREKAASSAPKFFSATMASDSSVRQASTMEGPLGPLGPSPSMTLSPLSAVRALGGFTPWPFQILPTNPA